MLLKDLFHGEQPVVLYPLEGQPSIALVMFAAGVVVTEAAFGTGLLFQVEERAAGAAVLQSQILFPCRCTRLINTYGKAVSCNIDAVMLGAGKGQGEVGVALNGSFA